jgi:hypothetical protein
LSTNQPAYGGTGRSTVPLQERLNLLNKTANAAMVCPDCGSSFFIKISAEQYSDAGYGTAQFRSLSMAPEVGFICICGHIVDPKEPATGSKDTRHSIFVECMKNAIQRQKDNDPRAIAAQTISLKEYEALQGEDEWLKSCVEQLSARVAALEPETAALTEDELDKQVTTFEQAPIPVVAQGLAQQSAAPVEVPSLNLSLPRRTGRAKKTEGGNV